MRRCFTPRANSMHELCRPTRVSCRGPVVGAQCYYDPDPCPRLALRRLLSARPGGGIHDILIAIAQFLLTSPGGKKIKTCVESCC